jgi:ABC-type antimicrobial peptide transport system permease subunit
MLKNYFKTAWRNLLNNKTYSAINILGLAAGMAVALLIGLWVYNEYSYDRFLPEHEQVYRVKRNFDSNGDTLTFSTTSLKLAEALRTQIPEIEYVVESDWMGQHGLKVGEKKIFLRGGQSGSDFLKVFQYPLLKGNANSVLNDPYSIVLTESTAKALFGNDDPINKMVRFDNKDELKVTGILKDFPANSTFQLNWIVPFSYIEQTNPRVKANRTGSFGGNSYQIFVKLKPGVTLAQVAPKVRLITHSETDNTNAMKSFVILHPMKDWHLKSEYENGQNVGGFIEYVRMFSIIGILVLLIACINFINLTTARSEKRAREVGVRKAIGSMRKHLVLQFLAESLLLTVFAFLFSLLFVQLALPAFNALTGSKISLPFSNIFFWLGMIGCVLITSLLAGSRPAFYLSSFNPVKVLKGTYQLGRSAALPRKVLVVLQFSCSIALIISTIIIYQQIQHAKNRPTGYDINRVVATNMNDDLRRNYVALRDELVREGIAESVTLATSPATDIYWHTDIDSWPGKNAGETVEMGCIVVGEDYFKTLGMKIQEGRDFSGLQDTLSVIFNETAIARLRIKNPINQVIKWGDAEFKIAGVVKDALMISPFAPADPTMFYIDGNPGKGNLMYRLSPQISTQEAIAKLTTIFNKYSPAYPYDYSFADANYAEKFRLELLIGKLSGVFAGLAILISCLGLFGLAAYIAEQRTKEIGIRKVLGASVPQVWLLLSKDFIVLVLISCVIASPLAYYFLQDWLQKYDYRIGIGFSVFVLAAAMAIIITIVTISFQAIKAAVANPVRSLRSE